MPFFHRVLPLLFSFPLLSSLSPPLSFDMAICRREAFVVVIMYSFLCSEWLCSPDTLQGYGTRSRHVCIQYPISSAVLDLISVVQRCVLCYFWKWGKKTPQCYTEQKNKVCVSVICLCRQMGVIQLHWIFRSCSLFLPVLVETLLNQCQYNSFRANAKLILKKGKL